MVLLVAVVAVVLWVSWGIPGVQGWLPPLLNLKRESGTQQRLSCLPLCENSVTGRLGPSTKKNIQLGGMGILMSKRIRTMP